MNKALSVEEGNKIISEFIGGQFNSAKNWVYFPLPKNQSFSVQNMQYHSSWDWLYPVIQKIAKIVIYTDFKSSKRLNACIEKWKPISKCLEIAGEQPEIFDHTVKFIQWYNSTQIKQ